MFDDLPAYRTMSTGTLDKLTCYLCSPPEDVANKDLLIWWNDHKCEYPCMARMALDYHTIPSKLLSYLILLWYTDQISKQVHLSMWSVSSVKDASFYPTFATTFLLNRHEPSFASVTGAGMVLWRTQTLSLLPFYRTSMVRSHHCRVAGITSGVDGTTCIALSCRVTHHSCLLCHVLVVVPIVIGLRCGLVVVLCLRCRWLAVVFVLSCIAVADLLLCLHCLVFALLLWTCCRVCIVFLCLVTLVGAWTWRTLFFSPPHMSVYKKTRST
jgi:hypothetical protein